MAKTQEQRQKQKAYDHARRIRLREAGINRDAVYTAAHRDEARARAKAWRAANPERSRSTVKAYRRSHTAQANAWSAAWKERNPTRVLVRMRLWAKKRRALRPEIGREVAARRKALKLQTQVEKVDLKKILRDSNGRCGICHKALDLFGIDFDHIVPLAKGGTHTFDNLQASHSRCNRRKGVRTA